MRWLLLGSTVWAGCAYEPGGVDAFDPSMIVRPFDGLPAAMATSSSTPGHAADDGTFGLDAWALGQSKFAVAARLGGPDDLQDDGAEFPVLRSDSLRSDLGVDATADSYYVYGDAREATNYVGAHETYYFKKGRCVAIKWEIGGHRWGGLGDAFRVRDLPAPLLSERAYVERTQGDLPGASDMSLYWESPKALALAFTAPINYAAFDAGSGRYSSTWTSNFLDWGVTRVVIVDRTAITWDSGSRPARTSLLVNIHDGFGALGPSTIR